MRTPKKLVICILFLFSSCNQTNLMQEPTTTIQTEVISIPTHDKYIAESCPSIFSLDDISDIESKSTVVLLKNRYLDDIRNAVLLNLSNQQITEFSNEGESLSYYSIAISPDYRTLAYRTIPQNEETIRLVLSNSIGERKKIISLESDIPFPMYGNVQKWLNNQQLLLDRNIFNPYTEETLLFDPDSFPNNAPDDFGIHSIQFDPTITRVIYTSSGAKIVMVDIKTKQVLAEIKAPYAGMPKIAWSSDAKWVAIVGENSETGSGDSDEIFLIDRDGNEVKQVTNLSTYEDSGVIFNLAWSPDNKQIAFWQNDISSNKKGLRLFVLDIETEKITSYCTWGETTANTFFGPIWSPDGKYLLIGDLRTEGIVNSIVIDIEKNIATIIGEDFIPVGWMLNQ